MKLMVIGGGGREHAIVHALAKSPKLDKLWCAPGNGGIAAEAECVEIKATDIPAMVLFSLLLRRAASWRWVRLAGLSFFLHALLTWLAPSVFFLYGIQIFETTGYALYAVASVYWVNDMTAPADRVQGQTYFTMANTLGIVLSSFLGGFLLDTAGTGPTLAFSTVTGGTGMGILWIMLRQGQAKAAVQQG